MIAKLRKFLLLPLFVTLACFCLSLFLFPKKTNSANLNNVKDTLSSSQLSYFARTSADNSAGQSILTINVAGNAPSQTSNNLFVGDTIAIGTTGADTSLTEYVILDIGDTATIQLTTGLSVDNAVEDAAFIATRSAVHTVTFTPVSILTAGKFQVLIKATDLGTTEIDDGIPDQDGFDLGMDVGATIGLGTQVKTADIGCSGVGFGVGATGAVSATTVGSDNYHLFTCTLGAGVSNATTEYAITIGRALDAGSQLINPSAATGHVEGEAGIQSGTPDVYTFYVRHLNSGDTLINSTQGKIAVIESVRVTATVDPSLTFRIDTDNSGVGDTRCGVALGAAAGNTTATAVNFGSLSLTGFNDLAQSLSCVTNAKSGYVVTVYSDGPLTEIGSTSPSTIPDTDCDAEDCTVSSATAWNTETDESGFGYSLEDVDADTIAFNYNDTAWSAKPFPTTSATAVELFSNSSTPTTTEDIYICYRIAISTVQRAGEYENGITYTATATF